jgi:hypothetical protein
MEIFDRSGRKVGYVNDIGGGCALVAVSALGLLLYWIWGPLTKVLSFFWKGISFVGWLIFVAPYEFIISYPSHGAPYNFIGGFYYYFFGYLFKILKSPFSAVGYILSRFEVGTIPYPRIEFIFRIIVILIVGFGPYCAIFYLFKRTYILEYLSEYLRIAFICFLLPAIVGILWFVISGITTWLFAKSV